MADLSGQALEAKVAQVPKTITSDAKFFGSHFRHQYDVDRVNEKISRKLEEIESKVHNQSNSRGTAD